MKKLSKVLTAKIASDKRLCDFSDERSSNDGIWVYTIKGYAVECKGLHTLHAENSKEMLELIDMIIPCNCKECI